MNSNTSLPVENYIIKLTRSKDKTFDFTLINSIKTHLPLIAFSQTVGKLLSALIQISGVKKILKVGTMVGYSAIWLAKSMPLHIRITTVEVNKSYVQIVKKNIAHASLADKVNILSYGNGLELIASLLHNNAEPFDLASIGTDKKANQEYFVQQCINLTHESSLIVIDNLLRMVGVLQSTLKKEYYKRIAKANKMLAKDLRLDSLTLSIVQNG